MSDNRYVPVDVVMKLATELSIRTQMGPHMYIVHVIELLHKLIAKHVVPAPSADKDTSDGHHTFGELYEHRHALFSVLCRTFIGWKSKLHDDGTMYEGWFIAGIETPTGTASYHLPIAWWDRFECRELDKAPKWDGHTPNDVIERIQSLRPAPSDDVAAARAKLQALIPDDVWKRYDECVDRAYSVGALKHLKNMQAEIGRRFIEVALDAAKSATQEGEK